MKPSHPFAAHLAGPTDIGCGSVLAMSTPTREPNDVPLFVRLPRSLKDALEAEADRAGISQSEVVRTALSLAFTPRRIVTGIDLERAAEIQKQHGEAWRSVMSMIVPEVETAVVQWGDPEVPSMAEVAEKFSRFTESNNIVREPASSDAVFAMDHALDVPFTPAGDDIEAYQARVRELRAQALGGGAEG